MKKIFILFAVFPLILFSSFIFGKNIQQAGQPFQLKEPIHFLFGDQDNDDVLDPKEPLVVMSADNYAKLFKRKAPLDRMLRSQIEDEEYIVLTPSDFNNMDVNKDSVITSADNDKLLYMIYFVQVGGTIEGDYIATEAERVDMGELKGIVLHTNQEQNRKLQTEHETHFKNGGNMKIKSSKEKLPWVGL